MLRRLTLSIVFLLVTTGAHPAGVGTVYIPMDQQINIGLGNAILPDGKTLGGLDRITFENESGVGFTRFHLVEGNGRNSYYDGPIIDLNLAGIGPVDLSVPGSRLSFDARYYQAPEDYPPGTPWIDHDAPIGVILTSASGRREFGYPYHSAFGDPPFPTWTHIDLDANALPTSKVNVTDFDTLDMTRITKVGFVGTDWPGQGNDFVDIRAVTISPVPEPEVYAMMGIGLGLVGWMARRRRRQDS